MRSLVYKNMNELLKRGTVKFLGSTDTIGTVENGVGGTEVSLSEAISAGDLLRIDMAGHFTKTSNTFRSNTLFMIPDDAFNGEPFYLANISGANGSYCNLVLIFGDTIKLTVGQTKTGYSYTQASIYKIS